LKRSYHSDIVDEILQQIDDGNDTIVIEKRLGPLRDRTVTWLWDAYQTLNNRTLVQKAFEMCRVRGFNLSYASLTSFAARDKLRNLKHDDPTFWQELTSGTSSAAPADGEGTFDEDEETDSTPFEDESNLPLDAVIARVID
ncbi:hypothetical protein BJ138DRAFT_989477, partial [Hygrophoropsis aurantiaca]